MNPRDIEAIVRAVVAQVTKTTAATPVIETEAPTERTDRPEKHDEMAASKRIGLVDALAALAPFSGAATDVRAALRRRYGRDELVLAPSASIFSQALWNARADLSRRGITMTRSVGERGDKRTYRYVIRPDQKPAAASTKRAAQTTAVADVAALVEAAFQRAGGASELVRATGIDKSCLYRARHGQGGLGENRLSILVAYVAGEPFAPHQPRTKPSGRHYRQRFASAMMGEDDSALVDLAIERAGSPAHLAAATKIPAGAIRNYTARTQALSADRRQLLEAYVEGPGAVANGQAGHAATGVQ